MKKLGPIFFTITMAIYYSACERPTSGDSSLNPPSKEKPSPVIDAGIKLPEDCRRETADPKEPTHEVSLGLTIALDTSTAKESTVSQCTALQLTAHSLVVSGQCYRCLLGDDKDSREVSLYRNSEKLETLSPTTEVREVLRTNVVDPLKTLMEIPVQTSLEGIGYPAGDVKQFLAITDELFYATRRRTVRVALPTGQFTDDIQPFSFFNKSAASIGDSAPAYTSRQFLIISRHNEDLSGGTLLLETEEGGFVTLGLVLHKLFPAYVETGAHAWVVEQILPSQQVPEASSECN